MSTPTSPHPWHFRGNGLRDANDRVILLTVPGSNLPIAEDDANKRCIELAPALVQAAARVIHNHDAEDEKQLNRAINELRDALAKLEGA